MDIYTIGHSNHRWAQFLPLLQQHGIEVLVDVRSNPVSRWASFANRSKLPGLLENQGINYLYLGGQIGGKPSDPRYYDVKGKPDYQKIRSEPLFQEGIQQLLLPAQKGRVALMCAEEDPARCHRRLLLGPALKEHGVRLLHIRKDGSVQAETEL